MTRDPTRGSWDGSRRCRAPPAVSSASAPARSSRPKRGCSTAAARPRTGPSPGGWPASSRPSTWIGPNLRPQLGDGLDGGGRHRGNRPGAVAGRGRPRHRGRANGRPLARAPFAPTGRADTVRGAGVDAASQTDVHPRGAGGHRGRTGGPHSIDDLARRAAMSPRHFTGCSPTRSVRRPVGTSSASAPRPRAGSWRNGRHRRGDRRPVWLRHRRNHAAQLHSPGRHPAGPIPQGLRVIRVRRNR